MRPLPDKELQESDLIHPNDLIIFTDNHQDTVCLSMVGLEVGVFLKHGIKAIVRND